MQIQHQIQQVQDSFDGTIGIAVKQLGKDNTFFFNANSVFPSASLMKIPLVCSVANAAITNDLSLDDRVNFDPTSQELTRQRKESGSGLLSRLSIPHSFSIRELCTMAIIISDNVAANFLLDMVGIEKINDFLVSVGLQITRVTHKFENFQDLEKPSANPTTPMEMLKLLELLQVNQLPLSHWIKTLLLNQQFRSRIPRYITCRANVANKTASLDTCAHDVGIVYKKKDEYIVCALSMAIEYRSALSGLESCLRIIGQGICVEPTGGNDQMDSVNHPDEFEMRNAFIELDVKAKTLGGIENLFQSDQLIYIEYGRKTGFLTNEEANEIAAQLGLKL